jgi:hypothetical protein
MNLRNFEAARANVRGRLLAAVVGGGAIAVMGTFAVSHDLVQPGGGQIVASSGHESPFPAPTSPSVGGMSVGATTSSVAPETELATSKAVPAIKAGG